MRVVIGALFIAVAICLGVVGSASADTTWVDEINNSLAFSTANYPSSNWEPYHKKIGVVREAVSSGDNQAVRMEMGKWFKMLRHRDNGISDVRRRVVQLFADGDADSGIRHCGPCRPGRPWRVGLLASSLLAEGRGSLWNDV